MIRIPRRFGRRLVGVLVGTAALGIAPEPAAAQETPPCETEEHRQFDFWVGEWEVSASGNVIGVNRIRREYGGCVLVERFTANSGYEGSSFNIYDAGGKRWHQTWVDNRGLLLELNGGLRDGSMVLEGERVTPDGRKIRDRITWTKQENGTIRQHWEIWTGEDWRTVFDGTYRKRS